MEVIGDYTLSKQVLGQGSFSTVYLGTNSRTNELVAIKQVKHQINKKMQDNLEREIAFLKRFRHPNIVALHGTVMHHERYIILEYCPGGDLHAFIKAHQRLTEDVALHFLRQLAAGLAFLQDKNVVHRDLKPQNLLLMENDSKAVLKIADFGFVRSLQSATHQLADTVCGSPLYMAPEVISGRRYDGKADLWSTGAILYEMLVGRTPFAGANHVELLYNMKNAQLRVPPSLSLSKPCFATLRMLLKREPTQRATFKEFFECDFLNIAKASIEGKASPPRVTSAPRASPPVAKASLRALTPPSNKIKKRITAHVTPPQAVVQPLAASPHLGEGLQGEGADPPPLSLAHEPQLLDESLSPSEEYVLVTSHRSPPREYRWGLRQQPKLSSLVRSWSVESVNRALFMTELMGRRALVLAKLGDAKTSLGYRAAHKSYIQSHMSLAKRRSRLIEASCRSGVDKMVARLFIVCGWDQPVPLTSTEKPEVDSKQCCGAFCTAKLKPTSWSSMPETEAGSECTAALLYSQAQLLYGKALKLLRAALALGQQGLEGSAGRRDLEPMARAARELVAWLEKQLAAVSERVQGRCKGRLMTDESQPWQGGSHSSSGVDQVVLQAAARLSVEAQALHMLGQREGGIQQMGKAAELIESLVLEAGHLQSSGDATRKGLLGMGKEYHQQAKRMERSPAGEKKK